MFKLSINSSFSFPFYPLLCLDYFSILNVLPIIYFSVTALLVFSHFFFLFPLTFSRVIAHPVFIDPFLIWVFIPSYRPIPYCLNVSYDLSFSSLPTSINSSRAFPMPIEPYVRLNMLRHWCFVTNMSRRAYTDLTQNNLVPLLPAHYCMFVFILSKHNCPLFFCHSLLFIFPIPLFNHLSPNISNFWVFSWPGDLIDLILL